MAIGRLVAGLTFLSLLIPVTAHADGTLLRFSKDPALKRREIDGFTYLLNALNLRSDRVIRRDEVDPGEKSVRRVDLKGIFESTDATRYTTAGFSDSLGFEGTQCTKEEGVTLRSLITLFTLQNAETYYQLRQYRQLDKFVTSEITTLDKEEHRNRKIAGPFLIPPGVSKVLQPGGIRLVELWNANQGAYSLEDVFVTYDFAKNRPLLDIQLFLETGRPDPRVRGQRAFSIPNAHEMIVTQKNGFFGGMLSLGNGALVDNAPINTVMPEADIKHPFFSCLQCHGGGGGILRSGWVENEEYKERVGKVNERYVAALKKAALTTGHGLYEYFQEVSDTWSVEHLAEELSVSKNDVETTLRKIFPKAQSDAYVRKGVPVSLLFPQESAQQLRHANDLPFKIGGFCELAYRNGKLLQQDYVKSLKLKAEGGDVLSVQDDIELLQKSFKQGR